MATNPLNINAASANELFKHLAEMSKSKSLQVVKKRKEATRQCFTQETFVTLCYSEKEQKRQTQLVNKWVKKGLIYFGPPGFTAGKCSRGAMPDQDSPHSTSPDDVNTAIPGDVEDNVFLGGGAVCYDWLTPGATPIPPRFTPPRYLPFPPLSPIPQTPMQPEDMPPYHRSSGLRRAYSVDRLNYQQRLNPSQFGPPVPPRVPLLGQSAGVQTSPEISTWEGMGAGVIVETHDVQTSPGLQAGDSAQVSQEEYQTVITCVRMLEQQLADKDAALLQHKTQAAASSRQFKETLQRQENEMQIRAHALQKREQEWEQETREANEQRHKEWEQERKNWWGERHQQEEGWRKEKEAWEREREALSVKAEQFRKA